MEKDHRNGSAAERGGAGDRSRRPKRRKDEEPEDGSDSGGGSGGSDSQPERRRRRRGKERRMSPSSDSESGSDSEEEDEERRRRRRRERRRREREREEEKERRRRRKEKEKKRRRLEKEKEKKKKERGKKGAVTNSWGKYGVIRETDMWNKRPEFTAWLAEIKQVNLESLANWEEKQLFKEFMEDHNTATFPSKKYYSLDAYHQHMMEKEIKRGFKKTVMVERTEFNDEEQRRQELMREREKHKEEQVNVLKRAMSAGMAQAMKEQAQLREEMAYQYKIGNYEAAAAIQRRLDPDAPPG